MENARKKRRVVGKSKQRYQIEPSGRSYVIVDTLAVSKRYRNVETLAKKNEAILKCRTFNLYVEGWKK
jgi:hypothetical protein